MLESGEFNLSEAADQLIAEGETDSASSSDSQLDGQSATDPNQTNEQDADPRDILNQVNNEKPAELDQALFDQINALGAIHNGLPISVKSQDELKELIQKGYDYTKKTMTHAEESRIKAEEFSKLDVQYKEKEAVLVQKEQEIQNQVTINNVINSLVDKWETADPELHAYIVNAAKQELNEQNKIHPSIAKYENQFKQMNDRFSALEKGNQQAELGSIKDGWEKDLNDVQTRQSAALLKLGVTPDWEKVKQAWTADSTNKLSVEDALYAVHGKDIALANKSYQNLLATKNKTQARMLGKSGINGQQRSAETIKAVAPGDYESILKQAIAQI